MVGSVASVWPSGSSSATTSMMKSYLQIGLWPLVKNSSQWKQLSSLRRCAISDGVRRFTAGPLTDAAEDVAPALEAAPAVAASGQNEGRGVAREDGGGVDHELSH
jgi:hypothetical protein